MPHNYFDERIATTYEERWPEVFDPAVVDGIVDFVASLAGGGPALELAVGTGRIALPLCRRGIRVRGIELSPQMVAELQKRPGADRVGVTIGDMATTRVVGRFRVVYLVANTIMNLTSQEAQVACFENAAAHLEPGGTFVVEVIVPALRRLPPGQSVVPFTATPEHVVIDEYDVSTQTSHSHHWWDLDGRLEYFSAPFRYVWPSELELMARIAGLSLRERWADWRRQPFTNESTGHVSVWEKPA